MRSRLDARNPDMRLRLAGTVLLLMAGLAQAIPTCAILVDTSPEPGGSPVTSLLEAELLQGNRATFLERSRIDAILREQHLQALAGPEAGRQRIELGRLLQADLLILLQQKDQQVPSLDIVVCETRGGLRLLAQTVPLSSDRQTDVADCRKRIEEAFARYERQITAVFAVPPFLDNDLTDESDHLKAAYARISEQVLLEQPGVLVVELAEARAVAQEITLGGGPNVQRPMPLYVLAEYRHDGFGPERKVKIDLSLKQGEKALATAHAADLDANDAVRFLRRTLIDWARLGTSASRPSATQPVPDPAAEARQLAERAKDFRRLRNWPQALALTQASLLLDPDQLPLYFSAAIAVSQILHTHIEYGTREASLRGMHAKLYYYRLGMQYLEYILRHTDAVPADVPYPYQSMAAWFYTPHDDLYKRSQDARLTQIHELCRQLAQEKIALLERVLTARLAAANFSDATLAILKTYACTGDDPPSIHDRYARVLQAVGMIRNDPVATRWTVEIVKAAIPDQAMDSPDGRAFLSQLEQMPDEQIRTAVGEIRATWIQNANVREQLRAGQTIESAAFRATASQAALQEQRNGQARFRLVDLACKDAKGRDMALPERIHGWYRAGEGIDAIWGRRGVYLMKQKGILKEVFRMPPGPICCLRPYYDGRFLWVVVSQPDLAVVVIDPVTEKTWSITSKDGLPTKGYGLIAPIGPGQVCLLACSNRSWYAMLTFDPDQGATAKIFYEARYGVTAQDTGRRDDLSSTTSNAFAFTVRNPSAAEAPQPHRRVLVDRSNTIWGVSQAWIDPQTLAVEPVTLKIGVGLSQEDFTPYEGSVYWASRNFGGERNACLYRVGFPTLNAEAVMQDTPEGCVAFWNDRIHIVNDTWSLADNLQDHFRTLQGKVPGDRLRRLGQSGHYGLLVLTNQEGDQGGVYLPLIEIATAQPGQRVAATQTTPVQ